MSAKGLDEAIIAAIFRYSRRHPTLTAADIRQSFERLNLRLTAKEAAEKKVAS